MRELEAVDTEAVAGAFPFVAILVFVAEVAFEFLSHPGTAEKTNGHN
jgi:hypothetical protein